MGQQRGLLSKPPMPPFKREQLDAFIAQQQIRVDGLQILYNWYRAQTQAVFGNAVPTGEALEFETKLLNRAKELLVEKHEEQGMPINAGVARFLGKRKRAMERVSEILDDPGLSWEIIEEVVDAVVNEFFGRKENAQ